MTTSLNLTLGVLGQLTLGCCGFEAIGAYSAALMSKLLVANGVQMDDTVRFLLVTFVGGVVACVFGVLVGIPALRLHGDYLAIITLGFGEIIRVIIQNLKVAGGKDNGVFRRFLFCLTQCLFRRTDLFIQVTF